MSENYLLFSVWTANLGVVPLLLLAALRFAPIFTFLAALLLRVTRVLDTIYILPVSNGTLTEAHKCKHYKICKLKYLYEFKNSVKALLLFLPLLTCSSFASTYFQGDRITIARGELIRHRHDNTQKFSIGNKEVIKVKADRGSLIIKALSLGVSDLLIWQKGSKYPKKIKVFVISKKKEREFQQWSTQLLNAGLKTRTWGDKLTISGLIAKQSQLKLVKDVIEHYPQKQLRLDIKLEEKIKNENFKKFIFDTLQVFGDELDCRSTHFYIECFDIDHEKEIKGYLSKKYLIKWLPNSLKDKRKQYFIKLKLYQFENLHGHQFSLGLYKLQSDLGSIINKSPLTLINKNTVALRKSRYSFSTLAEPTITGRLGHPVIVKLGSDIPYTNTSREGVTTTQWRFAGLDIKMLLKKSGDQLLIEYTNGLSHPSQNIIQSNQQSSSVVLKEGQSKIIFNIGFLLNNTQDEQLPGLERIPLLNKLFSSTEQNKTYKKVVGLLEIKEI